ncbi:MAG: CTP synthase, partial [Caulobacterales bacterium]|nr:CTP synthase [Caulobacterales bacterium]
KKDNVTTGRIYQGVIEKERHGDFLGSTGQVIHDVTDAIKSFVLADAGDVDFVLCEIGGTVGDIEGLPFFEAIRQLGQEMGRERALFLHVTLVPYIKAAGELKTKPTQHSVKEMRSIGLQPDILLCRCEYPLPAEERRKLALFCNVRAEAVIEARDAASIYQVPLAYHENGLDAQVLSHFGVEHAPEPDLSAWRDIVTRIQEPDGEVTVAVIGKYVALRDAYKSLLEALVHGGLANRVRVNVEWLASEEFTDDRSSGRLEGVHAILVPGGFGERGSEGKIAAVRYARESKVPFFGICFGMQMAVVEAARHLARLDGASSSEFGPAAHPVVGLMTEWTRDNARVTRTEEDDLGGTQRLGAYTAVLRPDSKVAGIYGETLISERHRHRYEVNAAYRGPLEEAGLRFTGMSPDGELPEIVERDDHPWFVGVQFHPELKSRPFDPHPLFVSFIAAAVAQSRLV